MSSAIQARWALRPEVGPIQRNFCFSGNLLRFPIPDQISGHLKKPVSLERRDLELQISNINVLISTTIYCAFKIRASFGDNRGGDQEIFRRSRYLA